MKKTLVAVATVAALGAATIPAAQAHDGAGPFIAGAVFGAVVGSVLSQPAVEYVPAPTPVVISPPVVYYPPPPSRVVYYSPPPVAVYPVPESVYYGPPGRRHGWYKHEWQRAYYQHDDD